MFKTFNKSSVFFQKGSVDSRTCFFFCVQRNMCEKVTLSIIGDFESTSPELCLAPEVWQSFPSSYALCGSCLLRVTVDFGLLPTEALVSSHVLGVRGTVDATPAPSLGSVKAVRLRLHSCPFALRMFQHPSGTSCHVVQQITINLLQPVSKSGKLHERWSSFSMQG